MVCLGLMTITTLDYSYAMLCHALAVTFKLNARLNLSRQATTQSLGPL